MGSIEEPKSNNIKYDMIIIGAGISGINAGYRIQTETPYLNYTILESRGEMGGTWDLFRYPGIRSDSNLHTFGFSWRPWSSPKTIAEAPAIRKYIKDSAAEYGIDRKIQFHHKLIAANWSSKQQEWHLTVEAEGTTKCFTAQFVLFGTGYYDYKTPLDAPIPGIGSFQGPVVHPQFWPEDLNYKDKNIVIVGSGATAITLLPNLAKTATHVTMLQRSPSYILAVPSVNPLGEFLKRWLPSWLAFRVIRMESLVVPFLFFQWCRSFPNAARKFMRGQMAKRIPKGMSPDPDFQPRYNPWEQRLCVCPDGDFYDCLHNGRASITTGHIDTVTSDSIVMKDGKTLHPDVIVTATGLKILVAGGARITIDNDPLKIPEKFFWKGVMLQDVPNAAVVIGYTNASWTLGADATAKTVCRLIKHMRSRGLGVAVPRVQPGVVMKATSCLNLTSTYIEKAKGDLPKVSLDNGPWQGRKNYFWDLWQAKYGSLEDGMEFVPENVRDL